MSLFFNKYFCMYYLYPVVLNMYYFLNFYFKFDIKIYLLKKNNFNFLFFNMYYVYFKITKIFIVCIISLKLIKFLFYSKYKYKKKIYIGKLIKNYKLKEKQKLNFFLFKFYIKGFFATTRED